MSLKPGGMLLSISSQSLLLELELQLSVRCTLLAMSMTSSSATSAAASLSMEMRAIFSSISEASLQFFSVICCFEAIASIGSAIIAHSVFQSSIPCVRNKLNHHIADFILTFSHSSYMIFGQFSCGLLNHANVLLMGLHNNNRNV